jgi:5-hydroxyisourate hydrolase
MTSISTHVLDTARGQPAPGIQVLLHILGDKSNWTEVARATTGRDGRIKSLLDANTPLTKAVYRLTFETAAYFESSRLGVFYPKVEVVIAVADPKQHYHIPLLLSPFGYSTYRGS